MARARNAAQEGQTYGGPAADGPTPTVPIGDPAPDGANLTGSKPDAPAKTVTLKSPWGSKVTVAAEHADTFKEQGFTSSK